MRTDQLEHAIRAATDILGDDTVIIIGSQSVLGSYSDEELPMEAIVSMEVDVLPVDDPDEQKADELDGAIGEGSMFHETHGFYVQGVGQRTATLPSGWHQRLVRVSSPATNGRSGLCLELHDLCISKLVANREKDRTFCSAMVRHDLVSLETLHERLEQTDTDPATATRVGSWISAARR
jgi:hypothetical protein